MRGTRVLLSSVLALTVLALTVPSRLLAQERNLSWSPEKGLEIVVVQQTAISPDGTRVAYVVREPLIEGRKSEYLSHIWMVPTDGSYGTQFTRGPESATDPTFAPDGAWLAFLSRRAVASDTSEQNDGDDDARRRPSQVWVIPVTGGEAFPVTDAEAGVSSFLWGDSGDRIAYLAADAETEEEKARRKEKRDVIFVDRGFKYDHIYTVPFDPTAPTPGPATRHTEGDFHVTGYDLSPDGNTFVFAHQADPRLDEGARASDISTVPADGSRRVTPLVTTGGTEGAPMYSPDGRTVAFTSSGDTAQRVGLSDVYVVPAGGGRPTRLADSHDRSGGLLGWSPDGSSVLLQETVGTTRHLTALPVDGGPLRQVTRGAGVLAAASIASDADAMSFAWQTMDTPVQVHVSPISSFEPTRLTDLHADVSIPDMGKTELLTWTSKDGRFEIEGLLTYPVDYDAGRSYPLILNVHGGPAGAYTQSFTGNASIYNIQYFADRGYAVLRPNPRGSTGYGRDFRFANVRDWGYGDMDDLMAGVDEVIDRGVAHPDSLLLMGWSYGGYMTSFAVTRTDRFKAASMGAGLPNLVSMVTTTDIGEYLVAHMGGAELWEDYDAYERHSAIYRIANVTTPTQVIHGENDLRVPFTQGQEFYRALQRRGVPTEMIVLPRTPHGPREPKLQAEVSKVILDWFEEHLRPDRATITTQAH